MVSDTPQPELAYYQQQYAASHRALCLFLLLQCRSRNDMLDAGPLLDPPFAGTLPGCGTKVKPVWIHEQCAASAPEVWCSETTGAWHCVVEAIARARQIRCTCCRTSGAAICCLTCLAQRKGRGQKAGGQKGKAKPRVYEAEFPTL